MPTHGGDLGRQGTSSAPVLSRSSSRTLGQSPKKRNFRDTASEADSSSALDDKSGSENDVEPSRNNRNSLPTLSRQSLSMPAGTQIPSLANIRQEEDHDNRNIQTPEPTLNTHNGTMHVSLPASPAPLFSPSRALSPIPLTLGGPADPRTYSAVTTGLRSIESFVVQGEAGKGAYGLVRKVREKGPDGQAVGAR